MSGRVGYLIVTGAVWAALIFVLVVAVVSLLRGMQEARRHERRHWLARLSALPAPEPEAAEPPAPDGVPEPYLEPPPTLDEAP